ncbi:hypothetical protein Mzhil_0738 [Methanosalsum zhilinae DSM 4017]|uniref:Uncharacterized protein n=1 Tax=Methanosalsum zhilinae (strain DSM 4017 / NBRC 107636 / OCM 62 / WeN5) TaxID=679901 RepID=F7XKK0_METZD|nr:hypothetical protein [Methanosalsum zhilinae]AEH60603.1 hypothetical protein Mzhil_0738 [Methanosalsum zhilinae DSM 4017]
MTTKKELLDKIRLNCVECCGCPKEVRLCHIERCQFYPFRFGTDPYKTRRGGK